MIHINFSIILLTAALVWGGQLKGDTVYQGQIPSEDTIKISTAEMQQILHDLQRMQEEFSSQIKRLQTGIERIEADTSRNEIVVGNTRISIKSGGKDTVKTSKEKKERKNFETNLFLMDIGINNYLHQGNFSLPAAHEPLELSTTSSTNIAFHLVQQGLNLYKHKLHLIYGISLDLRNFQFRENITIEPGGDTLSYAVAPFQFRKNTYNIHTIMLPLMLHFESNVDDRSNSFRLVAGIYGGYNYSTFTRQVSRAEGRVKRDDFHANRVRYGLTARVGAGKYTMYGNYDISPMFREGRTPELNPLSIGLAINGFSW